MKENEQPRGFKKAKSRVESILNHSSKLKKLLSQAHHKAIRRKKQLDKVWEDLQTLFRMVNAWKAKKYTKLPWNSIIYACAAILYFVNPFDVIPDFIPISGLLDDITIITFVINSIKKDIEKFKAWEKQIDKTNE